MATDERSHGADPLAGLSEPERAEVRRRAGLRFPQPPLDQHDLANLGGPFPDGALEIFLASDHEVVRQD